MEPSTNPLIWIGAGSLVLLTRVVCHSWEDHFEFPHKAVEEQFRSSWFYDSIVSRRWSIVLWMCLVRLAVYFALLAHGLIPWYGAQPYLYLIPVPVLLALNAVEFGVLEMKILFRLIYVWQLYMPALIAVNHLVVAGSLVWMGPRHGYHDYLRGWFFTSAGENWKIKFVVQSVCALFIPLSVGAFGSLVPFWRAFPYRVMQLMFVCITSYILTWDRSDSRETVCAIWAGALTAWTMVMMMLNEQENQARQLYCKEHTNSITFVRCLSHKLRSQLHAVDSNANMLLSDTPDLSQDVRQKITDMYISSCQMDSIVNEVLFYSKLTNRQEIPLKSEPVKLKQQLLDRIEACHRPHLKDGVSMSSIIDKDVPESLMLDKAKVLQILDNLTANAVKFTTCGSVSLHCGLRIKERGGDNVLYFSVVDTGIGIDESNASLLREWNFFTQVNDPKALELNLTGIGLSLGVSKRLAQLLGGDLEFRSIASNGSMFVLELPLVRVLGRDDGGGSGNVHHMHPDLPPVLALTADCSDSVQEAEKAEEEEEASPSASACPCPAPTTTAPAAPAAPAAPTPAAPAPVLDRELGAEIWGSVDVWADSLAEFAATNLQTSLGKLEGARKDESWAALFSSAHAAKGCAAQLAAPRLVEKLHEVAAAAKKLVGMGGGGQEEAKAAIDGAMVSIRSAHEDILDALSRILPE